jgi:uncharacterized protein YjeT (DUF2065 family)
MSETQVLAEIIGPIALIAGLSLHLNKAIYQKLIQEFMKSPALMYLSGFMALVIGLLMVQYHNEWSGGLPVIIITLFGWLAVFKGAGLMMMPDKMKELTNSIALNNQKLTYASYFYIVVGAYLSYLAYFV